MNIDTELKQKLVKNLAESGFNAEMQARKIFTSLDWSTLASYYYFDKDEERTREMDILGYKNFSNETSKLQIGYQIVAEVKKSKNPWLIFVENYETQDKKIPSDSWAMYGSNLPGPQKSLSEIINKNALSRELKSLGYNIHEAFKDPDQPSKGYAAMIATCKATEDILNPKSENQLIGQKLIQALNFNPSKKSFLNIIKPIVIVEGLLMSVQIDDSGETCINEIPFAPVKFLYSSRNYNRTHYVVDIVTLDALTDYLIATEKRLNIMYTDITNLR